MCSSDLERKRQKEMERMEQGVDDVDAAGRRTEAGVGSASDATANDTKAGDTQASDTQASDAKVGDAGVSDAKVEEGGPS